MEAGLIIITVFASLFLGYILYIFSYLAYFYIQVRYGSTLQQMPAAVCRRLAHPFRTRATQRELTGQYNSEGDFYSLPLIDNITLHEERSRTSNAKRTQNRRSRKHRQRIQ